MISKVIRMKRLKLLLAITMLSLTMAAFAQTERKAVRQGNREFKKGEFIDSEISYRSALELNPTSIKGNFNLGDALYKQEKYEEATQTFSDLSNVQNNPLNTGQIYHNLGNAYFKQQKFEESVAAYKNALRNNPGDMETKYNLAQAQRMLMQQEQQQQDKDQKDDQDKNDDQKDEKQPKDNQDKPNENQDQKDKQDKQQQEKQITPEDARRMLEAIQNYEKEIQDRVRAEQAQKAKVKVEKNW